MKMPPLRRVIKWEQENSCLLLSLLAATGSNTEALASNTTLDATKNVSQGELGLHTV